MISPWLPAGLGVDWPHLKKERSGGQALESLPGNFARRSQGHSRVEDDGTFQQFLFILF